MRVSIRRRRSLDRYGEPYKYALTLDDIDTDDIARIRKALAVAFKDHPDACVFSDGWKLGVGIRV